MSSTISLYSEGTEIDNIQGENIYKNKNIVQVTLHNVDAGDFVNEFMVNEILDKIDFDDIDKYYQRVINE